LTPVALIMASLSAPRDPFGRGREAGASKRALDMTSDHMACIRAHAEWSASHASCEALGIHGPTMKDVDRTAKLLSREVVEVWGQGRSAHAQLDLHASDMALVKACILIGAASQVMRLQPLDGREAKDGSRRWSLRWRSGGAKKVVESTLKPHGASLLADGRVPCKPGDFCVCYGVLRSVRGTVALDVTLVSPLAVLLFGGSVGQNALDVVGERSGGEPTLVHVGGEVLSLDSADASHLLALRQQIASSIGRTGAEVAHCDRLCTLLSLLLRDMDSPWSGVPEGWSYQEDALAKPLYVSFIDKNTALRTKPTETAARVAKRAEELRASKAKRAQASSAAAEAQAAEEAKASAEAKVAELVPESAEQLALRETERVAAAEAKAAAGAAAAEAAAAKAAAAVAELKAVTMARVAADEAKARESTSVAGKAIRGGVAKLLADLELTQYADAFANAGYDDDRLREIAEVVDEDRDGEGTGLIDTLIEETGLKGGSAVKLRRRLLEPAKVGSRGTDGGSTNGSGKSGGKGRGGGSNNSADATAKQQPGAKSKAVAKSKNK